MHVGRGYTLREGIVWAFSELTLIVVVAAVPTLAWGFFNQTWLAMPWQPLALVGTAVAFVTSFKNNAAYSRLWEARQIWGQITSASRTWATLALSLPTCEPVHCRALLHGHLAWLTALRFQLREPRSWEATTRAANRAYEHWFTVPELTSTVMAELAAFVPRDELAAVADRSNRAAWLLAQQSRRVRALADAHALSEPRLIELERTLAALADAQARVERIKDFPYPRQFASLNSLFVWLLVLPLPLALLPELHHLGPGYIWLTIPIASVVSAIFHMMDKIGENSENPFCGGPNDVPITAVSRSIEIEFCELLNEPAPPRIEPHHDILM